MIGSEALPFSKTGGLADVLGALPSALAHLGWDVTLVVPRYRGVSAGEFRETIGLSVGGVPIEVGIFETPLSDGGRALLVDAPTLFDRATLYGVGSTDFPDNPYRFAVLTRAALEWASRQRTGPSIVHAHDWQAGLAPVYLRTMYAEHPTLAQTRSVFTIHNLAYQGVVDSSWMPRLDLPRELFTMEQLEYWGQLSFLKGGIVDADVITTVSPQYAKEIQTADGGVGFDGVLRSRADRLVGILNGIDSSQWNPQTDPLIPRAYSADDLSGKRAAKAAVLAEYHLPTDDEALNRPLIGMISRMVEQKGLDLIERLAGDLPHLGATFVILGTGEAKYQELWRWLAGQYPNRIGARIGFDERLAHLIEAGSDLFLMPSRFEPCGLNQMYSLRYGTVPIVRRVGGLADTVTDYQPDTPESTGFVFTDYSPWALLNTIRRALTLFQDAGAWKALQVAGMRLDHSWDRSAREYVKIYERAINQGRA
ncbi:MAG: glycogen synthase GlgA [Vicinamibacterales bacterium]